MNDRDLTPWSVAVAALAGTVVLVALAFLVSARVAILGLAAFALAGAIARVGTPLRRAFVVRRRTIDVSVLAVLGLVLLYLGLTTPLS